jgi:lauroyl/myristoyl acyltransferase
LLSPWLGAYPALRPSHARRLEALFDVSPFAGTLTLDAYYRRRLDLALASLRLHGRPLDCAAVRVEGGERYREALASGRPLALMGLHMGVVELLHRLPEAPEGRPFRIVTAGGFAGPLSDFLREGRERGGKTVLSNHALAGSLKGLVGAGGVLAFMADQVPGSPEDRVVLWNSVELPWPRRLIRFLRERNCAILPVSTRVAEDGTWDYRYHVPWPDAGYGVEDSERVKSFLEEAIAWAPDQWNWSYPKLRPATAAFSR